MGHPAAKQINHRLSVSVAIQGWPFWTHIYVGDTSVGLNEEEARDLLYAMQRIVAWLDLQENKK